MLASSRLGFVVGAAGAARRAGGARVTSSSNALRQPPQPEQVASLLRLGKHLAARLLPRRPKGLDEWRRHFPEGPRGSLSRPLPRRSSRPSSSSARTSSNELGNKSAPTRERWQAAFLGPLEPRERRREISGLPTSRSGGRLRKSRAGKSRRVFYCSKADFAPPGAPGTKEAPGRDAARRAETIIHCRDFPCLRTRPGRPPPTSSGPRRRPVAAGRSP